MYAIHQKRYHSISFNGITQYMQTRKSTQTFQRIIHKCLFMRMDSIHSQIGNII